MHTKGTVQKDPSGGTNNREGKNQLDGAEYRQSTFPRQIGRPEKYQNKAATTERKLGIDEIFASAEAHEQKHIELANHHSPVSSKSEYLGSFVYGGLDGIITTFAIVSGVVGANLPPGIILVLGLANLVGDGFSMAVGAYLSSRSEQEVFTEERRNTAKEIVSQPEQEKGSLTRFYQQQGYSEQDSRQLANIITRDPGRWVKAMMAEQHLLLPQRRRPVFEGLTTFIAFLLAGSIPLLVYFSDLIFRFDLASSTAFMVTILMTALALLGLGAVKVYITGRNPLRSAVEMLAVGALAAGVAYSIGMLLKNFAGISG